LSILYLMQNYVSLNVDYVDFNRSGELGLGGREVIGEREKGEKGEKGDKNKKSVEKTNNTNIENNINEVVYKTIVMPFYIPLVDYAISNDLFIEIIDSLNKNQIIGEGKIRKYRLNGPPANYDMFIETEKENVYHVKKRGIMMRVKVSGDQYKVIVKMLTSLNGGGVGDTNANVQNQIIPTTHNVLVKKKTGFLNWFACFRGV
jgi:hypothetical protein